MGSHSKLNNYLSVKFSYLIFPSQSYYCQPHVEEFNVPHENQRREKQLSQSSLTDNEKQNLYNLIQKERKNSKHKNVIEVRQPNKLGRPLTLTITPKAIKSEVGKDSLRKRAKQSAEFLKTVVVGDFPMNETTEQNLLLTHQKQGKILNLEIETVAPPNFQKIKSWNS